METLRRLESWVLLLWMNSIFSCKISLTFNYHTWYFSSSAKVSFPKSSIPCIITACSANTVQAAGCSLLAKQQFYLQNILSIHHLIKLTW